MRIHRCKQLYAQEDGYEHEIKGFVFERDTRGDLRPLPGAHVFFIKDQQGGAITDVSGSFVLVTKKQFPHSIAASFVGYNPDTIYLNKAQIFSCLRARTLNEVELVDRKKSTAKSLIKVNNVEWISELNYKRQHVATCQKVLRLILQ